MSSETHVSHTLLTTQPSSNRHLQQNAANFVNSERLSVALVKIKRDMDELWQLTDEIGLDLTRYDVEMVDSIESFEYMRNVHRISRDVYDAVQALSEIATESTCRLGSKVEDFGRRINAHASNRGLGRLPDELLIEVLFLASSQIKTALALSHVCRRLRSLVLGSREIWSDFMLMSSWTPSKIFAVAERSGFRSLRATLEVRATTGARYDVKSVDAILNLHEYLEELHIDYADVATDKKIRSCLTSSPLPALRSMSIRCPLPFVSSHFHNIATIPTLRALDVEFIPHPSWATGLVQCRLYVGSGSLSLRDLLRFLSSAIHLQQLALIFVPDSDDEDTTDLSETVSLPNLICLRMECASSPEVDAARTCMEKIVPFSVQELALKTYDSDVHLEPIFAFSETKPSIREIAVKTAAQYSCEGARVDLMTIPVDCVPRHIEILSLEGASKDTIGTLAVGRSKKLRASQLRLIRLKSCDIEKSYLRSLRNRFVKSGRHTVQFEFQDCPCVKDGTFGVHDIENAFQDDKVM